MRTRRLIACGLAALSLAATGCSEEEADESAANLSEQATESEGAAAEPAPAEPPEVAGKPKVTVPEGPPPTELQIEDIKPGTGKVATAGSQLSMNYVGVNYSNGEEFDSSFTAGAPIEFQLGTGAVIPGWDQGIEGMKVGGRRQLVIPPALAYGAQGSPPVIGPNETLVFVVDLLAVK